MHTLKCIPWHIYCEISTFSEKKLYLKMLTRDIPEWPHQSCQPNLIHFTHVKYITTWEGRDGITLHLFPACNCWELDQLFIRRHTTKDLKWTNKFWDPFRPTRGVFGLPGANNNKIWHKTKCCNVLSYFW